MGVIFRCYLLGLALKLVAVVEASGRRGIGRTWRRDDAGRVEVGRSIHGRGRLSVRLLAFWERMFDNSLAAR